MDDTLRKVQELELYIAKEVKRICEKHNIPYFILAGTLLGAVRHGGFIPWDDDIDIGMLREDYNRFLEACQTDLKEAFFLQTWDTDPEFPFSYAKVRLKGTHFVEKFSEGTKAQNGIFVDIFPYDHAPDSPEDAKKHAQQYFLCKRILWIKKGFGKNICHESAKQAIKYYLCRAAVFFIPYVAVKNYFQQLQQKYNSAMTQGVVTDGAYAYRKETIKKEWVERLEEIEFEDERFLTFKDWHAYLQHLYGDYMVPPPVEQRYGHQLLQVDFGDFES